MEKKGDFVFLILRIHGLDWTEYLPFCLENVPNGYFIQWALFGSEDGARQLNKAATLTPISYTNNFPNGLHIKQSLSCTSSTFRESTLIFFFLTLKMLHAQKTKFCIWTESLININAHFVLLKPFALKINQIFTWVLCRKWCEEFHSVQKCELPFLLRSQAKVRETFEATVAAVLCCYVYY